MNNFWRSRWNSLLIVVATLLAVMVVMASGYPAIQRRGPWIGDASVSSQYGLQRQGFCTDEQEYRDCYLCGKVTDSRQVYLRCCDRDTAVLEFCDRLFS